MYLVEYILLHIVNFFCRLDILLPFCCEFNWCICQRVMPSSTPPRPSSMPLSPSSTYPPMPTGQVVYPSPQPQPAFVSVPQSQSNQRVAAGHQNKRGILHCYLYADFFKSDACTFV